MDNLNDKFIRHFLTSELGRLQGGKVRRLLDVGCGDLRYKALYAKAADIVVALDVERRSAGISVVGSVTRIPVMDDTFDVVICTEVIEHVRDAKAAVYELTRVLRPGGVLLLTFPFLFGLHETPNDFSRPTEFAVSSWLRELPLASEMCVRRGGAATLVYTIVTAFVQGAVAAAIRSNRLFAPVGYLANSLLAATHSIAFQFCIWTGGLRSHEIGSGLDGVCGQLAHWPLGYCFSLRKHDITENR